MTNIIASYWSVAGDRFPGCGNESSPLSFHERYETAAKLGFRGAGFIHQDLLAAERTIGYNELHRILTANGIDDIEVEILHDWFADGKRRVVSDAMRSDLLAAAEIMGARHIKIAGDFHGEHYPIDRMAEEFAILCEQAANVGALVGIEVMPFTNIRRLDQGIELIERAGAKNGGLLLDIWHMERGGIDYDDIANLPTGSIISIEIDDAKAEIQGDIWNDTLHHRLPCGEGDFKIPQFLAAVEKTGYAGPIGVEFISAHHRKLPLADAAKRTIESARRYV